MALYSLANQAGAAFRGALNTVLGKIQSNYAGTTDPVSASENAAGMLWLDTNTTPPTLKIRNAANAAWISVGQVDTNFLLAGTTPFARTILDDTTAEAARTTLGLTDAIVTTTLASQAEAEAGTNNTKLVTPLRVAQYVDQEVAGLAGRARAWVSFDGTGSITIKDSMNVSSIGDLGIGYYRINFTEAFQNTNFAVVTQPSALGLGNNSIYSGKVVNKTTSRVDVGFLANNTYSDFNDIAVVVY